MVLIEEQNVKDIVSCLDNKEEKFEGTIFKRKGSFSVQFRKNSSDKVDENEPRQRCSSISMKTYKPHLITENRRKVEDFCRDLVVNNDHIHIIEMRLRAAISRGVRRESHQSSSVKCYPTYVTKLPTGRESGKFLALDLGGTNFRVLFMNIGEDGEFKMESQVFNISQSIMLGSGEQLFDFVAQCLASFIQKRNLSEETLPLGFTFSFPLIQEGLAVGRLAQWTKGFKCSSVEGNDVVELLRMAIDRRGDVKIDVLAILNDTTGTLMSSAWKDPKCRIGLILGTGTNACYLEDVRNVSTFTSDTDDDTHVIINTEWGAFGDNNELEFVRTRWDRQVDHKSLNPGQRLFIRISHLRLMVVENFTAWSCLPCLWLVVIVSSSSNFHH